MKKSKTKNFISGDDECSTWTLWRWGVQHARTHPEAHIRLETIKKKKQKSPRSSVSNNGEKGQEKRKINWFNLETKSSRQRSGRFVFEERVAPSGV